MHWHDNRSPCSGYPGNGQHSIGGIIHRVFVTTIMKLGKIRNYAWMPLDIPIIAALMSSSLDLTLMGHQGQ